MEINTFCLVVTSRAVPCLALSCLKPCPQNFLCGLIFLATRIQRIRSTKILFFQKNVSKSGNFRKHPFPTLAWMDKNETFQKRLPHDMVSRVRFKMANGRITFVILLLLWLFLSLIVCLEINLASLNFQADHVRRRLNIIRLL